MMKRAHLKLHFVSVWLDWLDILTHLCHTRTVNNIESLNVRNVWFESNIFCKSDLLRSIITRSILLGILLSIVFVAILRI